VDVDADGRERAEVHHNFASIYYFLPPFTLHPNRPLDMQMKG
jgi:hypothetical protein